MLAAWRARARVILSHHGVYRGNGVVGKLLELVKRQLARLYPNISVSQFVADNIPGKSVVIHNAYDAGLFKQPAKSERDRDFVFCGRLVSDKGADVCVHALSEVLRVVPDTTLTIIGSGPEQPALQALAERLSISGNIHFTGALGGADLVQALQGHACMLVPSLWEEPFGIVALEGIACCDTVIVSRRGGLSEAVGECGLVVEPAVEHMAKAMTAVAQARRAGEKLPGQPDDATRMAHLARHMPEGVARQYLKVIEGVARR